MTPMLIMAVTLVPGLVGLWAGYHWAPSLPQLTGRALLAQCRHLIAIAFLPFAFMVANVLLETRPDWQWQLPFWVQAHSDALYRLLIFSCTNYVFGVVTGVYWGRRHSQRWIVLVLAVLLMVTLAFVAHPKQTSPLQLSHPRLSADGDVLQSTPYTCMPATVANLLRQFGVSKTEAELTLALGTSKDGTSSGRAALEFQHQGFHVTKRTVSDCDLMALIPPAMLLVDGDGHVVAFFGLTNNMARIVDPGSGSRLIHQKRLSQRWTGRALEISRTSETKKGKKELPTKQ